MGCDNVPLLSLAVVPATAAELRLRLNVTLDEATGGYSVPEGTAMSPVAALVFNTPSLPAAQPCTRKPLASTRYPLVPTVNDPSRVYSGTPLPFFTMKKPWP